MPIDPYAALNALIRAEAVRFSPAAREDRPVPPVPAPASTPEAEATPEATPAPGAAEATAGSGGEPQRHTAGPAA
ncbi:MULTISPECIES: hypothetical protein [unclassified Streptomyces]|uniref:hypothetical protein n=1 Tax=unclassified Streptomyces TaxID=2593676 RepID=UPI003326458D